MLESEMEKKLNQKYNQVRYKSCPWFCDDRTIESVLTGWIAGIAESTVQIVPQDVIYNQRQQRAYEKHGIEKLLKISIAKSRLLPD